MVRSANISNRSPKCINNDTSNSSLTRSQSKKNFAPLPKETPVLGLGIGGEMRDNRYMRCNLLEFNEVCDLLKIGRTTLYSLVNTKSIRAVKLLGRTLFREADVCEFIATLPEYEGGANGF